jgi:hypothetical protein
MEPFPVLRIPPGAIVTRSCSWCRTMNRSTVRWCRTCGHAAQLPRLACACPHCPPPAVEAEAHD